MDYATILTAIGASVATGLVSTVSTVAALRVHIKYLRKQGDKHERRMTSAEKRLASNECDISQLQTKTKGL